MVLKFFKVFPNPHAFLDADGNPQGVLVRDGNETGGALRYVGATVSAVVLDAAKTLSSRSRDRQGNLRTVTATLSKQREKARFTFNETEPDMVPASPYYRLALQRGEIFPADAETARAVGVPFTSVDALRQGAKDKAAKEWTAAYGEAPEWAETAKTVAATG